MADDFDWAERRRFLTSFFFFCLAARAFTLRRSASLPEQVSTAQAELSSFFFLPPLADDIPGSQLGVRGRSSACCAGEEEKRSIGREDASQDWTPVCRSVFPSRLGCHHSALPSAEQSSQAVPEEHRTGRPLIVPLGFSSLSWIPFAALILRRLVCADWPLWILD